MLYFNKYFPIRKYSLKEDKKWVNMEILNSSFGLRKLFNMKKNYLNLNEEYKKGKKAHFNSINETKKVFMKIIS